MALLHYENGGLIGGGARQTNQNSGIWSLGAQGQQFAQSSASTVSDPSLASSYITTQPGFQIPTSQSFREYYYAARKLTVFYEDAYGATTHIALNNAYNDGYTDVRNIMNEDGVGNGSNTFLVSVGYSRVGYIYDKDVIVYGVRFYGNYSTINLSSQGSLYLNKWDNSSWSIMANLPSVSSMNSNSGGGYTYTFETPVRARGFALSCKTISTYMPVSFFAPLTQDGSSILGVT